MKSWNEEYGKGKVSASKLPRSPGSPPVSRGPSVKMCQYNFKNIWKLFVYNSLVSLHTLNHEKPKWRIWQKEARYQLPRSPGSPPVSEALLWAGQCPVTPYKLPCLHHINETHMCTLMKLSSEYVHTIHAIVTTNSHAYILHKSNPCVWIHTRRAHS